MVEILVSSCVVISNFIMDDEKASLKRIEIKPRVAESGLYSILSRGWKYFC